MTVVRCPGPGVDLERPRFVLGSVAGAGSLGGVALEGGHALCPADRLDVLVQDLVGLRCIRRLLDDRVRVRQRRSAVKVGQIRSRSRPRATAMAGVTGHYLAAAEVSLVDRGHHRDHHAGHLLPRAVGGIHRPVGVAGRMAVFTRHAERGRKNAHGAHELVHRNALEHLHVLEHLVGHRRRRGSRSTLTARDRHRSDPDCRQRRTAHDRLLRATSHRITLALRTFGPDLGTLGPDPRTSHIRTGPSHPRTVAPRTVDSSDYTDPYRARQCELFPHPFDRVSPE